MILITWHLEKEKNLVMVTKTSVIAGDSGEGGVCMHAQWLSHVQLFATPTGLLRPWGLPGKNTGVGCHFLGERGGGVK